MLSFRLLLIFAFLPQLADSALTVVAEPDSLVVWDGVELGRTDSRGRLEIGQIPLGEYEIEVSKPGFLPARLRIEVSSGHRELNLSMVPVRPLPPPPERPPPSPLQAAARVVKDSQPAPAVIESPPDRRQETRVSQVADGRLLDMPWGLILPPVVLLAGLLLWLVRNYGLRRPYAADGPASPEFHDSFAEDPVAPAHGSSISFLDDLRRREAMAERGFHVPPQEDGATAIDLDEDDVRSFEDPENP